VRHARKTCDEFLTASGPERSLPAFVVFFTTQIDPKGDLVGLWCRGAVERNVAPMAHGGSRTETGDDRAARSVVFGAFPYRHIACTFVPRKGAEVAAPILMAVETHPQFAHVCKGGRTGRDGP